MQINDYQLFNLKNPIKPLQVPNKSRTSLEQVSYKALIMFHLGHYLFFHFVYGADGLQERIRGNGKAVDTFLHQELRKIRKV